MYYCLKQQVDKLKNEMDAAVHANEEADIVGECIATPQEAIGTGIQTKLGERAGRLVIPAIGRNIYSDDHGEHWVYQTMPTIDDRIVTLWQTRRQTQTNGT